MPQTVRRARHREVVAPAHRAARHGLHTLVLAVIAGGTVAFAGVTVPDPSTTLSAANAAPAAVTGGTALERGEVVASRLEARTPLPGTSVEIVVDGEARELTTQAATVAELLAEAEVLVDHDDVVSVPLASPVHAGLTIEVTTVETVDEHRTQTDEHDTVEEEDDSLPRGEREVLTEGVDGVTAQTVRVTTSGGTEMARELVARAVVSERVDEVVRVGTAEPVDTTPQPTSESGASSSSGGSSTGETSSSSASAAPAPSGGSPKAIAADMVAARGWGDDQYRCLVTLWERESSWNHTAQNPSSGAYGIPQSLPGSKMASAGADWRTNPATQITWGLGYISGRYGTPCGALSHSNAHNWY